MTTDFDDARRMLVYLLARDGDGPVDGAELLSPMDRLFLINTCASEMIIAALCESCNYDADLALEGLDVLMEEMRKIMLKRFVEKR